MPALRNARASQPVERLVVPALPQRQRLIPHPPLPHMNTDEKQLQLDAPEPISEAEAIKLWHQDTEAHRRESAFEWFAAGLIAAQRHFGIFK